MNINTKIVTALNPLGLTVAADFYEGVADDYIVFNYSDERPVLRADDTDIEDETSIQVHYFTRGDPATNKPLIRRYLKAAGFTITSTQQYYESDTGRTHVIVSAVIDGSIND